MFVPFLLMLVSSAPASDLIPDMMIWRDKLFDTSIDTNTLPGRTLLRLSTGTPNIGVGRLELRGGSVIDGKQEVWQRIYRTDGTFWNRLAGYFTYHQGHNHIHFDDWCIYRLRERTQDGGVGQVIATGAKVSFCVLDLVVYDSTLPGFENGGRYRTCGSQVQGISIGWADIYDRSLPDQWIDITGIPNGIYWLEAEVDPNDAILELDETNNVDRVPVAIGPPPPVLPDRFEENDTKEQVDGRPEGGENSPNFGLVNSKLRIEDLSMQSNDPDWFKFRLNATGGPGDYIQIESPYNSGDMDLELRDANGSVLSRSQSPTNFESLSLNGRPAGTYYARVYPYSGSNPLYFFTIQPSGNHVPQIEVHEPSSHEYVETAFEAFQVRWTAFDPDGDPMFVSLFLDKDATWDKDTYAIPGYQNIPADPGVVNVNTALVPLGTYFVGLTVHDGGSFGYGWAPGKVTLYMKGDIDFDGKITLHDVGLALKAQNQGWWPLLYNIVFDMDRDGDFDRDDLKILSEAFTLPGRRP